MKNLEELTLTVNQCKSLDGLKQLSESILESDEIHPNIRRQISKTILEHRKQLIENTDQRDHTNVQIITNLSEHKIELDPLESICVIGDPNLLRTPSLLDEAKINKLFEDAKQLKLDPIVTISPNSILDHRFIAESLSKKYTDIGILVEDNEISGPFGLIKDALINHPEIKNIVLVCESNYVDQYELAGQFFMNEAKGNRFIICPFDLDPIEDEGVPINECYMLSLVGDGDYKQYSQLSMFTEDAVNQHIYHELLQEILE